MFYSETKTVCKVKKKKSYYQIFLRFFLETQCYGLPVTAFLYLNIVGTDKFLSPLFTLFKSKYDGIFCVPYFAMSL